MSSMEAPSLFASTLRLLLPFTVVQLEGEAAPPVGKTNAATKLSACSGDTEKTIAAFYPQLPLLLRLLECPGRAITLTHTQIPS